jgi:tetratricopeptide (TPR) repeat protein
MTQGLRYRSRKCLAMALLFFGRQSAALEVFESMLREFAGDDDYALASKGHLLAQMGRKRPAEEAYRQLVAAHPDNARHWFNFGFLLEQLDQYEEAEAAFRRATELSPKLDRAWYGLGLVLIRLQRFDEALAALKKNTQLQPMSPYGWYQLARVHVDRHEPDEALRIIRHLKRFEPKVAAQLERETGIVVPPVS